MFEWFTSLLSQLEVEQGEVVGNMHRFLEMHLFITSALQRTDMKAVSLQLAMDLLHKKVGYHNQRCSRQNECYRRRETW